MANQSGALGVMLLLLFAASASADQVTLRPNATGAVCNDWTIDGSSPAATKHESVDDPDPHDGDTTRVDADAGNNSRQTFHVPNAGIPSNSTVNGVSIYYVHKRDGTKDSSLTCTISDESACSGGGISDCTVSNTSTDSYQEHFEDINTDPFTGAAWTAATVNDWANGGGAERTFGVKRTSGPRNVRVTQIEVLVDYTPGNTAPDVNVVAPSADGNVLVGVVGISFDVQDTDDDELHARIAYSTLAEGAGGFGTNIRADVNLDDHANDVNLGCVDTDWTNSTRCTYDWNTAEVSDANYYIDINVWDTSDANDSNFSDNDFEIDNVGVTLDITITNTPMAFALDPGIADENGSSDIPFLVTNDSSTDIDVSVDATLPAWSGDSGASDKNYYRFIADNNEASSCTTLDQTGWTDIWITNNSGTNTGLCQGFSNAAASNQLNVGIKILPPSDEPDATSTSSTVTFYIAEDTTGANDALITY